MTMPDDKQEEAKVVYRTYEDYCERFYKRSAKAAAGEKRDSAEAASFGKRLAKEILEEN
jgi:hypothetical protein